MIRYDFPQRSAEWHQARLGIPTSSEFHKIITPKTGKLSSQAAGYMHVLLAEWLLGAPLPSIETEYMQRGQQLEEEAVRAYEFASGLDTEKVGFITNDEGTYGCSPDRLVGLDGCLEIKCPAANTHVGHMLRMALDEKHAPQTQGQLLIPARQWVDTVSYYPGLPLVIVRTPRKEDYIKNLKEALDAFVDTLTAAKLAITQRYGAVSRILIEQLAIAEAREGLYGLGVSDEDVKAIWENSRL